MTKQEEIREGLERFYKAGNLTPVNVLFFLEKKGVVIKVIQKYPLQPHYIYEPLVGVK